MQAAYKYEIKGYVRRIESHSIIIEAEGTEENLMEFIQWCRRGSEYLKTLSIQTEELPLKNYFAFDIIPS